MEVMRRLLLFNWIVITCFDILSTAEGKTCFEFLRNSSVVLEKRLDGFNIRRYTDIGVQQCWDLCKSRPNCLSISYRTDKLMCFLSSTNVILQPDAMKNAKPFNYYTVRVDEVDQIQCGRHTCSQTESCIRLKNGESICVNSDLHCPGDGYHFNGFSKFCVKLSDDVRAYNDANLHCLGEGARFLRLSAKSKAKEISYWLSRTVNSSIDNIWIMGRSDPGQPFVFHNNKPMTYLNWAAGQPITGVSYRQGIVISVTSSYKWKSVDASEQHYYICEKQMDGSSLH